MFLVAVATYFLLACLASWLTFFPTGRDFFVQTMVACNLRIGQFMHTLVQGQATGVVKIQQAARHSLRNVMAFARQHYLLCVGGSALILLPPVLAFLSGLNVKLGDFVPDTRQANDHVLLLMKGEQLVPPPALPPAVFATVDLARERPMLVSASRKWDELDPAFTQTLLKIFKVMKNEHGYDMAILEGYRSPERQNRLAAMGPGVTNAAAFQSWHQYGLAADCAFLRNGKIVISEKDPWTMRGYELYGQVAESYGLTWGGRWKMMDFGHTELRRPGVMKRSR